MLSFSHNAFVTFRCSDFAFLFFSSVCTFQIHKLNQTEPSFRASEQKRLKNSQKRKRKIPGIIYL